MKQIKRFFKKKADNIRLRNRIRKNQDDLKIIIGSATTKQAGWLSTNYPKLDLTDECTFAELFKPGTVSNFLAEHVWEHLSLQDGATACLNCFAYLKQGGKLRIAVPDGFHPSEDYINQVKPGGTGSGSEDHKVLYNYQLITDILEKAGYQVRLLEWFDEHGNFNRVDWDGADGLIRRSSLHDPRNLVDKLSYTSLIVDAIKPEG